MAAAPENVGVPDLPWHVVERWQGYEGEGRANLLRAAAVVTFYLVELCNYNGLRLGAFEMPRVRDRPFHLAVTALAVAATAAALGVQACLRSRVFPAGLKYVATAADLVLLTAALALADGPRSPLVAGYFLVLAMATLRFSLPLVRFATAGAVASYLYLLGYAAWFAGRDIRVPRYHQAFVLLALVLTGVTLGQVVRGVRGMARDYAARVGSARAGGVP